MYICKKMIIMNKITPLPVLEHVVNVIKNTISDIKVEYVTISTARLKDGNDSIHLEQLADSTGNFASILIQDPKEIIISEDLLPTLKSLHEGVDGNLKVELQNATIIVNDLDVDTQLIFQAVKDAFDQISNSYELIKTIQKETTKVKSTFKFGTHKFDLTVVNETAQVSMESEFASSFDPTIKKTIEADAAKVQKAVNAMFKAAN